MSFSVNNKKIEPNMYKKENYLLIGLDGKCREIALEKRKQIKITRKRNMKSLKSIGLNKKISSGIIDLLEKSGCSLAEQRMIIKHFKKLLLDFKRDVHNNLELGRINLNRLPLSLRRLIIALIVLKAEIAHLFRLEKEKQREIREKNNRPNISMDSYISIPNIDLDLDNHKLHHIGISLSKGSYEGMRDFSAETNQEQNDYHKKKMNFDFNTTKNTKNKTDKKRQKEKQSSFEERADIDDVNDINNSFIANDQYKDQTN